MLAEKGEKTQSDPLQFLQIQSPKGTNEMLLRALEVIRWRKPKRPLLLRAGALALQLNNQATAHWAVELFSFLPC